MAKCFELANIKRNKTKRVGLMYAWLLMFIDIEYNYCDWNPIRIIEGSDHWGSDNRGSTVTWFVVFSFMWYLYDVWMSVCIHLHKSHTMMMTMMVTRAVKCWTLTVSQGGTIHSIHYIIGIGNGSCELILVIHALANNRSWKCFLNNSNRKASFSRRIRLQEYW